MLYGGQGQQGGGSEGITVARDKRPGEGEKRHCGRQQQEEGILINHARLERGMWGLDLQELSQAINFH